MTQHQEWLLKLRRFRKMNKVILIGNLTKEPQVTQTTNGVKVAQFSIAVQRKFADKDGNKATDFFNIVAWRNLAELVGKYLKKGSKVGISGTLQTRSYENKDKVKINVTEIMAEDIEFLSQKQGEQGEKGASKTSKPTQQFTLIEDDTLPF